MTAAWAGVDTSKGEAARFEKDLRKGLVASAHAAYRTQIQAIEEQLRQSRDAANALLVEQKAACAADYAAIKAKADEAFTIASDLARQERDAERDAKKRACALEASAMRERIRRKAELEAAKRQAKRELAASLRTIRRKGRKDVEASQIADEERRAVDQHVTTLTELDRELKRLAALGKQSLAEQRAICQHEYDVLRAKSAEACAEAQRLARAEREAKKAAKKKQCALEAQWIRDTQREEAQALREKKTAERALRAETRQIEASTQPRKPKAPKHEPKPLEPRTRPGKPKAAEARTSRAGVAIKKASPEKIALAKGNGFTGTPQEYRSYSSQARSMAASADALTHAAKDHPTWELLDKAKMASRDASGMHQRAAFSYVALTGLEPLEHEKEDQRLQRQAVELDRVRPRERDDLATPKAPTGASRRYGLVKLVPS